MVEIDLTCDLNGLKLKNPVLTASGTFGTGKEFQDFFDLNLLGAIVTKTVTLEKREGNLPPRICETRSGIINAIGLQNPGVEEFIKNNKEWFESLNTKIIVSVSGKNVEEYVTVCIKLRENLEIDAVELNVSCPNEKKGGFSFSHDPDAVYEIVESVKKETDLFVITKLSPWTHIIKEVASASESAGSDAICASNTIPALALNLETGKSRIGNVTGGLSGPAIKPVSQKICYDIINTVSIPVIGAGGIENAEDALEYIMLGATAVEVGSANLYNPLACVEIIDGIGEYLKNRNIDRILDIKGSFKG